MFFSHSCHVAAISGIYSELASGSHSVGEIALSDADVRFLANTAVKVCFFFCLPDEILLITHDSLQNFLYFPFLTKSKQIIYFVLTFSRYNPIVKLKKRR
jgi:hypothetical protein